MNRRSFLALLPFISVAAKAAVAQERDGFDRDEWINIDLSPFPPSSGPKWNPAANMGEVKWINIPDGIPGAKYQLDAHPIRYEQNGR